MTTYPDSESAQAVIEVLLKERLAACIQEMPIKSHYVWEGAIQNESEVLLLIKGKSENFEVIKKAILAHHKYEVPEIIQLPVTSGLESYLSWLEGK